jgi:Heterokaryon incompatibility protein (HET)
MCQLFGSMSPSDFNEDGSARSERCHLRAFSANQVFARLPATEMREIHDITLLGVVRVDISDANSGRNLSVFGLRDCLQETGCLCSTQANQRQSVLGIRRLSLKSFDLKFAIDCLSYSLANHHVACGATESSPTELVSLLRVIDCHTHTIIPAPAEWQYVALSYVWGCPTSPTTGTEAQDIQPTLQNAPKVVKDAIEVTLKLHLRYLWVDRYCTTNRTQTTSMSKFD